MISGLEPLEYCIFQPIALFIASRAPTVAVGYRINRICSKGIGPPSSAAPNVKAPTEKNVTNKPFLSNLYD